LVFRLHTTTLDRVTEGPRSDRLADRVKAWIEENLRNGDLSPGAVLDERSLAERLGVSRTPVREAVQQLAAHGALQVIPRVGVVVSKLDLVAVLTLVEMLAETEAICAKFASRRIDSAERAELSAALDDCRQAAENDSQDGYTVANRRFHQAIYVAAHNDWALQSANSLRLRSAAYRRTPFDAPGRIAQSLAEHEAIAAAIFAGDDCGAWRAMHDHIAIGNQDVTEYISRLNSELIAGPGD
jgi:DNA-binding GntR family transcriptional regulator